MIKVIGSVSAWKNDLDYALARLKSFGFSKVDLIVIESWGLVSLKALCEDFEKEASRVEQLLDKHGLKASSVNSGFNHPMHDRSDAEANARLPEQVKVLTRFMERLGVKKGTHYPGHIADWRNDPEAVWEGTLESLKAVQAAVAESSVNLGPELHFNTPIEKPEDGRKLLKEIPGLFYTYEPSHYIVRGIDIESTADLLAGAGNIHIRGCGKDRLQAPPEVGEKELKWVVEQLQARDYPGTISIEYLPNADFDSEQAIRDLKAKLESWGCKS